MAGEGADSILSGFLFTVIPASVIQSPASTTSWRVGFQAIDGLESELSTIEYQEYDSQLKALSVPDRESSSPVVMRRGVDLQNDLANWHTSLKLLDPHSTIAETRFAQSTDGPMDNLKIDLVVISYGEVDQFSSGTDINARNRNSRSWLISQAWPSKISVTGFDAQTSGLLVEEVTFQHQGIFPINDTVPF